MIHTNYWSCSRFANWVLNTFSSTPKPETGTPKEWSNWHKQMKSSSPIVHWFTEEFLDSVQNVLYWPYEKFYDARCYFYNRFVHKTHYLRTGLETGQYHSVEERIMNGLFTELVDFIEVEKAWHHCACDKEARKQYGVPWWRKWSLWRCSEAGLSLLDWEIGLKDEDGNPTQQAKDAADQKFLYEWWKNVRPNRPDPYEQSGWTEYCANKRIDDDILSMLNNEGHEEECEKLLDSLKDIEAKYDEEDTKNLIILILGRKGLWT